MVLIRSRSALSLSRTQAYLKGLLPSSGSSFTIVFLRLENFQSSFSHPNCLRDRHHISGGVDVSLPNLLTFRATENIFALKTGCFDYFKIIEKTGATRL